MYKTTTARSVILINDKYFLAIDEPLYGIPSPWSQAGKEKYTALNNQIMKDHVMSRLDVWIDEDSEFKQSIAKIIYTPVDEFNAILIVIHKSGRIHMLKIRGMAIVNLAEGTHEIFEALRKN